MKHSRTAPFLFALNTQTLFAQRDHGLGHALQIHAQRHPLYTIQDETAMSILAIAKLALAK